MARTSPEIGMDEITWLQGCSVRPPSDSTTTDVARPSRWRMEVMRVSITTLDPWATTLSRQTSHIIPGPYFGYWNSSISDVICFLPPAFMRLGLMASTKADQTVRFLMRCAAKSAEISDAGRPQSFSLYDLKRWP